MDPTSGTSLGTLCQPLCSWPPWLYRKAAQSPTPQMRTWKRQGLVEAPQSRAVPHLALLCHSPATAMFPWPDQVTRQCERTELCLRTQAQPDPVRHSCSGPASPPAQSPARQALLLDAHQGGGLPCPGQSGRRGRGVGVLAPVSLEALRNRGLLCESQGEFKRNLNFQKGLGQVTKEPLIWRPHRKDNAKKIP